MPEKLLTILVLSKWIQKGHLVHHTRSHFEYTRSRTFRNKFASLYTFQSHLLEACITFFLSSADFHVAAPSLNDVFCYRMGSFTSMPKIRPAPNADDQDVDFGPNRITLEAFLKRCRDELGNRPAVIPRQSRQRTTSLSKDGNEGFYISNAYALMNTEQIRVFQWNALSQGK